MPPKPKPKSRAKGKPRSRPRKKRNRRRSASKNKAKPKSAIPKTALPKSATPKYPTPKSNAVPKSTAVPKSATSPAKTAPVAAPAEKVFPLENCRRPEELQPTDITRLYRIPNERFETDGDVIAHNGYMLEDKLDEGGFGVIFFARNKRSNVRVACKLMDLGTDWQDERVVDMKNELFIMEKVKHLYVVKLHTHFLTQSCSGNRLYIFMELADGGNMAKFCQKKGVMTETEAKLYLSQILCGINHMHSLGIAHRDIKLQNILLVSDESSISGDYTLLVADFGLSRILRHDAGGNVAPNRTICGTPIFMSPELLIRKPYNSFMVDVWALGITLFIMVTHELPFDYRDEDAVIKDMVTRKWSWPEESMKDWPSEQMDSLMKSLLEPEAAKRITMTQLIQHPWLATEYQKAQSLANRRRK